MREQDAFNNVDLRAVGRQLRFLRNSKGWSLADLATVSGVSAGAIRNIESGTSNPSLLTILAIVESLEEPIDRLIQAAREHRDKVVVSRATESGREATPPGGRRSLTGPLRDASMDAQLVTLSPGSSFRWPDSDTNAVFGLVVGGTITVSHGAGEEACRNGDAFHVLDTTRSEIRATSEREARLVLIRDSENNRLSEEA